VSGENEKQIQKVFADELGAKYPLVKIKEADKAAYGIRAYPTVYVLDPDGNVVSNSMPGEQQLEELLKRVVLPPKLPDDAKWDAVRAGWKKADYAKLRDQLDKALAAPGLDAAGKDVLTAQREYLDRRMQSTLTRIEALGKGPDYVAADDALEAIEKQWKGMAPADAAAKERARFTTDEAVKKELSAGRALQKLLASYDLSKSSTKKKLVPELEKFAKKYEGTHAGKQATAKVAAMSGNGG
jgi:hypothetical protein